MTRTLKSIGTAAVEIATAAVIVRLLPALAAGLVAMAHELHFDGARAEAVRRSKGA